MERKQSTAFQRTTTRFFTLAPLSLLVLVGVLLPSNTHAAWTEPTANPPGGNVAAPLNVSDVDQVKRRGTLTVTNRSDENLGETDLGVFSVQGVSPDAGGGQTTSGVLGTGRTADVGGVSAGVYGVSYSTPGTGLHVGLLGVADANTSNSYGVYGWDNNRPNAYAGYFKGRTGVEGEICLNGDCINDWNQAGGGGLFTHTPGNNITYRTDTSANIAFGGTNDQAKFFFNVDGPNSGTFVAEKSITVGPDVGGTGGNGICTSPPEDCDDPDCWGRRNSCGPQQICDPGGNGQCVNEDTIPPTPPGNLRLERPAEPTSVPLQWDASSDAGGSGLAGYRIYRCQGAGCTPTVQLQQVGLQTTYTDSSVSPSTTYNYRVTAFDGQNNESSPSNTLEVATPAGGGDVTPPSIPQNLRTNGTLLNNLVPMAWDPSQDEPGGSGLAGYKLYRCSSSPSCTPTLYQTLGLVTTYDDSGVSPNTLYIYYVTAFDNRNNESGQSNWLPVLTPGGGGSPVILKDPPPEPLPPPPGEGLLEEALKNIARRSREPAKPADEPVIAGVRPLSRLLSMPTAQAKFDLFSLPTAYAAPPFGGNGNIRITVNDGVIQIRTPGVPEDEVMELGNGSSDIASTADINIRPSDDAGSPVRGASFIRVGGDTALRLTSHLTVGDSGTTDAGSIRYNSGDLEGYVGGQWVSLTNHGTGGVVVNPNQVIWNTQGTPPLGGFPQPQASFNIQGSGTIGDTLRSRYGAIDELFYAGTTRDANQTITDAALFASQLNGRVGIGTLAPAQRLHIYGSAIVLSGSDSHGDIFLDGGTDDKATIFNYGGPAGAIDFAYIDGGVPDYVGSRQTNLEIMNSGNVGIGTGNGDPLTRLHVVGDTKIGDVGASSDLIIGRTAAATGTTPQSDICFTKADGVLECINEWSDLSGFGVGIGGSGTANYIPRFTAANALGDSVLYQDAASQIGINRTSLAARLDVGGSLRARGQLYVDPNDDGVPELFVNQASNTARIVIGSNVATAAFLTVDNGSIWARDTGGDIVIGGTTTGTGQVAGTPELCFQTSCIDAFNDLILNTAAFGLNAQPGGFYVAGNGRVGGTLTADQGPLELPTFNRANFAPRFERNNSSLDGYNISTKLVFGAATNQWGLGIFSDENTTVPIVTISEDRKVHIGSAANPSQICLYGPGSPGCRSDWPNQSGGVVTNANQVIWNTQGTPPLGGFPQPQASFDIQGSGTVSDRLTSRYGVVLETLGVGTATPATRVHVADSGRPLDLTFQQASNATEATRISLRKARGTLTAPLVTQPNDSLGELYADGYDGTSYEQAASIRFAVDGVPVDGRVPGRISFWNTSQAPGAVPLENVRINSSGQVGIGTASPVNRLDVKGGVAIGQYAGSNAAAADGLIVSGHVGIGTNESTIPYTLAIKTPVRFNTVFAYDGASTYIDFTNEAGTSFGNPFSFLSDANDILYVGRSGEFGAVSFDFASGAAGLNRIVEYWNGTAWTALTITDGTNNLSQDGAITYTVPLDWALNAVNGQTRNWVRVRTTSVPTTAPTAYVITPEVADRFGVFAQSGDANPTFVVDQRGTVAIGGNAGGTKLTVMGGSVGIGTTTPSQQLSVSGNISTAGTYYQGTTPGTSVLAACPGGDVVGSIDVRGGIVTALGCEPDDTGITGTGQLNNIPKFLSANTVGLSSIWQAAGLNNIGIGDSSPVSLLTVGFNDPFQVNDSGDIVKIKNVTYSWPTAAPTAGTYLGSDGSGNLSWTVPPGGGGGILTNANQVIWNTQGTPPLGGFPQPQASFDIQGSGTVSDRLTSRYGVVLETLGVGTATPATRVHVAQDSAPLDLTFQQAANAAEATRISLRKARGTLAAPAVVQNNDSLGELYADGYDSTSYEQAASIRFTVDGAVADGDVPGRIGFFTQQAGAAGIVERLRITQGGGVGIGTMTPLGSLDIAGGVSIGAYAGVDAPPPNGLIVSGNTGIGTSDIGSPADFTLNVNTPDRFDAVFFFDGTSYLNVTNESRTSYGVAYSVLGDANDIFYTGRNTTFTSIAFDFATPGVGVIRAVEYWNGTAWTTLSHFDGTSNLTQDGTLLFVPPANWAMTAVNGQSRYWVRVRTTTNPTTAATAYSTTPDGADRLGVYAQNEANPTFVVDRRGLVRIEGNAGPTKLTVMGGNVGIGTTNPASLFSVGGTNQFQINGSGNIVSINGIAYSWPAAQGAAGTVLRNDGSGILSWAAGGGGGVVTNANQVIWNTQGTPPLGGFPQPTASFDIQGSGTVSDRLTSRYGVVLETLGVGTASPAAPLHVVGDGLFGTVAANLTSIQARLNDTFGNPEFIIRDRDGGSAGNIHFWGQDGADGIGTRIRFVGGANPALALYHGCRTVGLLDQPCGREGVYLDNNVILRLGSTANTFSFMFQDDGNNLLAMLREDTNGGVINKPEFGIGTNSPEGSLVIAAHNITSAPTNPTGQNENAISAYAEEVAGGNTGSAVYAEQRSTDGYAGYFSGRTLVASETVVTPTIDPNSALGVFSNDSFTSALHVENQATGFNGPGYAAQLFGKVGIFDGKQMGGTEYGAAFHLGGRTRGVVTPPPEGAAKPWTSFYTFQAEWSFGSEDAQCLRVTPNPLDNGANNRYLLRFNGPNCSTGFTSFGPGSGMGVNLEPNEYVVVMRARRNVSVPAGTAFRVEIVAAAGGNYSRDVLTTEFDGTNWTTFVFPFRQDRRSGATAESVSIRFQPRNNAGNLDFDYYAVYPAFAPVGTFIK